MKAAIRIRVIRMIHLDQLNRFDWEITKSIENHSEYPSGSHQPTEPVESFEFETNNLIATESHESNESSNPDHPADLSDSQLSETVQNDWKWFVRHSRITSIDWFEWMMWFTLGWFWIKMIHSDRPASSSECVTEACTCTQSSVLPQWQRSRTHHSTTLF